MPVTYYVALPFTDSEEGPMPGQAIECQSHGGAISAARTLSAKEGIVGALAFSRTGEPDLGEPIACAPVAPGTLGAAPGEPIAVACAPAAPGIVFRASDDLVSKHLQPVGGTREGPRVARLCSAQVDRRGDVARFWVECHAR